METLTISAKSLGNFATTDACSRCLWLSLHVKKIPYQIFPGIFNSIDAYTKRVIERFIQTNGCLPPWLLELGSISRHIPSPSYHRFSITDTATGVALRGTPDGIFQMQDGSHIIVDELLSNVVYGRLGGTPC